MMKAVNAKEFDMVASWSVDRLGRSLTDLLSILQSPHEKGVDLFHHHFGSQYSHPESGALPADLGGPLTRHLGRHTAITAKALAPARSLPCHARLPRQLPHRLADAVAFRQAKALTSIKE
jgi:hypothetical protein